MKSKDFGNLCLTMLNGMNIQGADLDTAVEFKRMAALIAIGEIELTEVEECQT